MRVLTEKELIQIQARGGKAVGANGKIVFPRKSATVTPKSEGPAAVDPMAEVIEIVKDWVKADKQQKQKVEALFLELIEKLAIRHDEAPTIAPHHTTLSWRFEVTRNGEGFIQEITAHPAKGA